MPRTLAEAVSVTMVYLAFAGIECLWYVAVTVALGWMVDSCTVTCLTNAINSRTGLTTPTVALQYGAVCTQVAPQLQTSRTDLTLNSVNPCS
jgi:hypothetical protein